MQKLFHINQVAVLGAGVMGAQIAAQLTNAGIETFLFDLPAKDGPLNGIVDKAIANLSRLKPSPLGSTNIASLIKAKNYQENLEDLRSCDLIIEAIAERLDWKEELYQKISPYLQEDTILVSNTSGLSIETLASVLPQAQQEKFCGVHFFNPPRYMHLVELIPTTKTAAATVNALETWLTRFVGKGVVRAKDTPNFIANRIGVFSLLATLHYAEKYDISLDEVDALTGTLIGRPKSATFRTMDVVGLDTMKHVVLNMHENLANDPWHKFFKLPDWLEKLIQQGHLGQKTGQGIYRKNGKVIEVYDVKQSDYRPVNAKVEIDPRDLLKLFASSNKQAQFLAACFKDVFHYAAFHLETIAHSARDVDLAMQWGFGWQQGPFATWEAAGVQAVKNSLDVSTIPLPKWLDNLQNFYTSEMHSTLPVYRRQLKLNKIEPVYENAGVILREMQDDIMALSFKSKANSIGQAVLDGCSAALDIVEAKAQGVIIYQEDANTFSAGADLRAVAELIKTQQWAKLENMIQEFQQLAMRLKYSPFPTVAALRGRALGGGCELMMHCDRIIAGFESYPGLVEIGIGLIPAGGGCKEMAKRATKHTDKNTLFPVIKNYFEKIATAWVAGSALEAAQHGYLQPQDKWLMNSAEVLYAACVQIKTMNELNYQPPLSETFFVAGREGKARLQAGLVNWLEGGFISAHDYLIANELAAVLCGGDINEGDFVDEAWILKLEIQAFIKLAQTAPTQARIQHLLETGKPLRN